MKKQILGIALVMILLTGCGVNSVKNEEIISQEQKDYIYVAETEDFISTDYISGICSSLDKLYISTYNEEKKDNRAYTIDITTRKSTPLRLPLEQDTASTINGMTTDKDGNLVFIERYAGDDINEQNDFVYIKTCAPSGGEALSQIDITGRVVQSGARFVSGFIMDKDNNYYLLLDKTIQVLNPQGQFLFEVHPNIKWFMGMELTADGQVAFLAASNTDGGLVLGVLDAQTRQISKTYEGVAKGASMGRLAAGHDGKMYVSANNKVYAYDLETGSYEEELSWEESRVDSNAICYLKVPDENHIVVVLSEGKMDNVSYHTEISYLTKTPRDEVSQKEIITLGTIEYLDSIQEKVNYFNSTNEEYQIEVREYCSDVYDDQELQEAIKRMQLEIVTGEAPDIIVNFGRLNIAQLTEKGAFEDLYPYLKADEDLKDVRFFQTVLDFCSWNGKLYFLPESFSLSGFCSREAIIGTRDVAEGITREEIIQAFENYEGEKPLVKTVMKSDFLNIFLRETYGQYVDWSTGTCNFESDEFKELLEFSAKYGLDETEHEERLELNDAELKELGRSMLEPADLYTVWDYKGVVSETDRAVLLGYPIIEGEQSNGMSFNFFNKFYITASSQNKEGAWEFIKCFQMPEYFAWQIEKYGAQYISFPIRKDLFDRLFEKWMETKVITDENGKEQVVSAYTYFDYYNGEGNLPVTLEDKETILRMIENARTVSSSYDDVILDIVEEETGAYFAGQKSVDEVAAIIQNRVQLYVNENW